MRKYFALMPILMMLAFLGSACRPQVSLTAAPDKIKQGQEAELSWTSKKAKAVAINNQPVEKLVGTMKVKPNESTTYEAVAKRGKKEARASARVEVIPLPTFSIGVQPSAIRRGQSATLQWTSNHADSVEISGIGRVDPSGTRAVSPQQSTSYTGVARGPGGEATGSASLTVLPPPTVSVSIQPTEINQGQSATLQWSSSNADFVEISGLGRIGASGTRSVSPQQSTTYTAIARGPGGEATGSTSIAVIPPRSIEQEFGTAVLTIYFAFDSSDLADEAQGRLKQAAEWLNRPENKTIRLKIEGNCDERGTEEYNLALGDRRANSAKDFLVSLGIAADRIEIISYGESRPADPGHDERAWALNRRDEFKYIEGGERFVRKR